MRSPRLVCCVTNAMRRRHFKSYTLAGDYSLMMFFAYIIKHKEELIMARFTGSIWKKSRRLGISLTGTGKELERRPYPPGQHRSEEHTSELQSRFDLVCRLLLDKKTE